MNARCPDLRSMVPIAAAARHRALHAIALGLALLAAGCDGAIARGALDSGGPQAAHIESLWWLYLAVTTTVLALVLASFVAALVTSRRRTLPKTDATETGGIRDALDSLDSLDALDSDVPALARELAPAGRVSVVLDAAGERRRTIAVGVSVAATAVILFALLAATLATGSKLNGLATDEDVLEIDVTATQWWWRVRYPNEADVSQIIETANEIHVPVGRTVVMHLTANDVIHSLWVPTLSGKRDLVPGRQNTLTLRADRPGTHYGQCAEFCGTAHARMSLLIIAESAEEFEQWRQAQLLPAPQPTTDATRRGQQVFLRSPCVMCHTIRGTGAQAGAGPDLTHMMTRQTLAAGVLPNTTGNLAGWILNAQAVKPGSHMPNINLAGDELQDLLAYLETLR